MLTIQQFSVLSVLKAMMQKKTLHIGLRVGHGCDPTQEPKHLTTSNNKKYENFPISNLFSLNSFSLFAARLENLVMSALSQVKEKGTLIL